MKKQITAIVDCNLFLEVLDLCCWNDVDGGRAWSNDLGVPPNDEIEIVGFDFNIN